MKNWGGGNVQVEVGLYYVQVLGRNPGGMLKEAYIYALKLGCRRGVFSDHWLY